MDKNTVFTGKTIYVEGCDFAGKTTLIKNLLPYEINNNTFLSDRSYATSVVYAQFFNRENVNLFELEKNFLYMMNSNKSYVWFLNPSDEEIIRRAKLREETHIKDIEGILAIKRLYEQFFKKYDYYSTIKIYTNNDVKQKILVEEEYINDIYKNNILLFDYRNLLLTLLHKENHEILGYRLNYNIKHEGDLYKMQKWANEISFDKNIFDKEKYERDMVLSNLKFNTHIMIDKYKENFKSRRFLSINDSCFSFTQVNIREDEIHFSFALRSTNVKKMLPVDLIFIFDLIYKYLDWLDQYHNYEYSNIFNSPIKVDIILNSAHLIME